MPVESSQASSWTVPCDLGVLTLTPATLAELDTVMDIIEEATAWLLERGVRQWVPGGYPRDWVREGVAAGALYLARLDGEAVATIRLQWDDEPVWGAAGLNGQAGYGHTLTMRRAVHGGGVGWALLRWLESRVIAAGRRWMRIDCMAANAALRAYYERQGFQLRGIKRSADWTAALYEKDLGEASGK